MNPTPATELADAVRGFPPGRALDLACGNGRNAIWLRDAGWKVTAVDLSIEPIDTDVIKNVTCIQADLTRGEFSIEPEAWDLIVCWLYWQEELLGPIAKGVAADGIVALSGKTSGRFATSLQRYRQAFANWQEIGAGEDASKAFFIARKPSQAGKIHPPD